MFGLSDEAQNAICIIAQWQIDNNAAAAEQGLGVRKDI